MHGIYITQPDVRRNKRAFSGNPAMIQRNEASESTFSDDMWEAITLLNDNNVVGFDKGIFESVTPPTYKDIRKRRAESTCGQ